MKNITLLFKIMIAAGVAFSFAACRSNPLGEQPTGESTITINMDIPASSVIESKSAEDESGVRTLDILFFDAADGNSANPIYKERRHLDYVITVELGKIRAVVKDLPLGTYRVLVIANSEAGMLDGITTSSTLSQVKASLVNKTSGTMPDANLLMAGESTKSETITSGAQVLSTITLVRAVARLDLICNLKNSFTTPFEMTSAEVRNTRNQSYVFGQALLADKDIVSFPPTSAIVDYVRPDVSDDMPTYADAEGNILSQLYAYENSSPGIATDREGTTCLIVGGKFNGSSSSTYYRIDISNSNKKHVLKRNHRYIISITAVLGPGYGTKDEAEQGLMNNIKAEIMEWVEGGSSGIVMEGNKMISVSKTQFDVEMYSYGQVLDMGVIIKNMKTDALRIDQNSESTEWLEIDNSDPFTTSGDNVYQKSVRLKIRQDNPSPDARTAMLKVSAGGAIYLIVKVVQGNSDRIMLDYVTPEIGSVAVTNQKIDFAFVDPNQNQPTTGLAWKAESRSEWITIDTTGGKPDSGIGAGSFYFNAGAHPTLGYSRRGTIRLTVSETIGGETKFYYRTIQVVQYNIDGSLEYVSIEGAQQEAIKIPDKGYSDEHTIAIHSRTAITLQKDGLPSGWDVDFRYVSDGAYILALNATAVADRTTATEKTLDTYRIGYLNFVNNQGKVLRTMLVYQGYLMALPNMAHIHASYNHSSLPSSPLTSINPNGLVPRFPDKPLIYELVSHRKKVWLDRNVNAEVSSIVPRTSIVWPDGVETEVHKQAVTMGSRMYPNASTIYNDSDRNIQIQKKRQGACPNGFRTPTQEDYSYTKTNFTILDDNPSIRYPWVYAVTITTCYFGVFFPYNDSASDVCMDVKYNLIYGTTGTGGGMGVYYRCISEK